MNRFLDPATALQDLAARLTAPHWTLAGIALCGRLGGCQCRARRFDGGLTVALTIERPPERAAEICLVLAATSEACDDGLYLDDGRLWLLRRFLPRLTEVEFDLLLKQQLTLASLLAYRPSAAGPGMPAIGRLA
ncbi:MAG: hypothetical protein JO171_10235 [Paludibacterium sp.]|uniref:hypothetical protein n=1 Tax=Paludibacterium sp. TaxID=1917523 RepID=UPI002600BCA5|nr:hypothetical protein [Paludibacterium sp.]MBV8047524.1 hypothetical protein [Paludibacterium sp.]MBV8649593.1 hypothetical protein [Paludibacterium sp.]